MVEARIAKGDPFWPSQVAVGLAIGLNLALSEKVTVGPGWPVAAGEGVLLLFLVSLVRGRADRRQPTIRRFALGVIGLVSLINIVNLGLLVHYLLKGGHAQGDQLIGSGLVLWLTSVLLFGVWYWELDRGGPVERHLATNALPPDFLFPQMDPDLKMPRWRAGFGDYLYLSLTNATAFSPTDTMPLTLTAKSVMALQSVTAFVTLGLVVARAVNILS